MAAVPTVADLQRVHLHHLRHGAAGVAAGLETMAGLWGVPVAEVVTGIDVAAGGEDPEAAGWARLVVPYVRAAIASGALAVEAG